MEGDLELFSVVRILKSPINDFEYIINIYLSYTCHILNIYLAWIFAEFSVRYPGNYSFLQVIGIFWPYL